MGDYGSALLPAGLLAPAAQLLAGRGIALAVLLLFTLIQVRGLRAGSASQEWLSLAKAIALLALVAGCYLLPGTAPLPGQAATAGLPGIEAGSNWRALLALLGLINTVSPAFLAGMAASAPCSAPPPWLWWPWPGP